MNIIITNRFGARRLTCDKHYLAMRLCFLGEATATIVPSDSDQLIDTENCIDCLNEARLAALPGRVRAALLSPRFAHTRQRSWCGASIIYVYHRHTTSPSGVLLEVSIGEPEFNVIYTDLIAQGMIRSSASPLSPTEGL